MYWNISCRRVTYKERDAMHRTVYNVWRQNAVICCLSNNTMSIDCFGINGSITCILTLFLAEYCGFGREVGTLFLILSASSGLRGSYGGPACLPANFQAIAKKKIKLSETKCQLFSQIHTTQPKITSLYM